MVVTVIIIKFDRGLAEDEQKQAQFAAAEAGRLDLPFESDASDMQTFSGGAVPAGTVIKGRYAVQEALGRGANAVTYRAIDNTNGHEVALKALSLRGLRDWKQLELFQREAVVLQGLAHPGIPAYIDYFEEDTANDRAFYIEVVQGKSLAQMVSSGMRADESQVMRIAQELLATLKYLAGLRPPVIHRDIKPENVVLEGGKWGGRVYLIDFGGVQGVANAAEFSLGSTIVGTYGYMAPEQFTGQASPASDLYSLGATLLFLVSGQPPGAFPQQRMRIGYRDRVTVGKQLGELLDGLLEPLAEDRLTPQEALDVASGKAGKRRKQAAAAAAQHKRRALQQQPIRVAWPAKMPTNPVRKPAGSRVQLTATAGKLDIDIPPEGLSGNNIGTGIFAVAWNAFVAFWTFSAIASGGILFALFSAPFWFAGYQLAGQAFAGALMHERFAIGRNKWRISQELAMIKNGVARFSGGGSGSSKQQEGDSSDLTGARVVTTMIVNGVPRTAIEVVEGVRKFRFGEALDYSEQEWLVWEINQHMAAARGAAPTMDDMPPEDRPEMYDDMDQASSAMTDIDPFWDMRSSSERDKLDPFRERDQFWRK
ncbi:kinase-like domain-containing protein [Scenedesmus sp. NREL 46B-D3]|nr:kinase-like domain-containing protein [Scenedesmus sp. NREL 46B-D3]